MVTIRCKRKVRCLCVACISEAMHARLNAKGNPKELAQAARHASPSVLSLAFSVGYNCR